MPLIGDEKICVPLNMQIHARMSEKLSCLITLVDVIVIIRNWYDTVW